MAKPSESFPILSQDKEMFAAFVASGVSYRDAAQMLWISPMLAPA